MKNYLEEMFSALIKYEVKFIVCGGIAVVLYGVERMTHDLDISVEMSSENLKKLVAAVKELKLVPRAPVKHDFIIDTENIRILREEKNALVFTYIDTENPYRQIDVFIDTAVRYPDLIKTVTQVAFGNMRIPVVGLDNLIRMKEAVQPPRGKDISDIDALRLIKDGNGNERK